MGTGAKQLRLCSTNDTTQLVKPLPFRVHSCKSPVRRPPVKLIRVDPCAYAAPKFHEGGSMVQAFVALSGYPTNSDQIRLIPTLKNIFLFGLGPDPFPLFVSVKIFRIRVHLPLKATFQKATRWSIHNRGKELKRIKRNIHLMLKNFSSCKTCMISMKRFQCVPCWHRRCLNAARTREMQFPVTEPDSLYEENRSDY